MTIKKAIGKRLTTAVAALVAVLAMTFALSSTSGATGAASPVLPVPTTDVGVWADVDAGSLVTMVRGVSRAAASSEPTDDIWAAVDTGSFGSGPR